MKVLILGMMLSIFGQPVYARGGRTYSSRGTGNHYVKGHTTKRGAYVKGHRQTNPDHTKMNNWSHKGNLNPYTGKMGTKN